MRGKGNLDDGKIIGDSCRQREKAYGIKKQEKPQRLRKMIEKTRKSLQIQNIRVTGRRNLSKSAKQKKKLDIQHQGGICNGVTRKEERPPEKVEVTDKRSEKEKKIELD